MQDREYYFYSVNTSQSELARTKFLAIEVGRVAEGPKRSTPLTSTRTASYVPSKMKGELIRDIDMASIDMSGSKKPYGCRLVGEAAFALPPTIVRSNRSTRYFHYGSNSSPGHKRFSPQVSSYKTNFDGISFRETSFGNARPTNMGGFLPNPTFQRQVDMESLHPEEAVDEPQSIYRAKLTTSDWLVTSACR